jgi:hypothetical protein
MVVPRVLHRCLLSSTTSVQLVAAMMNLVSSPFAVTIHFNLVISIRICGVITPRPIRLHGMALNLFCNLLLHEDCCLLRCYAV